MAGISMKNILTGAESEEDSDSSGSGRMSPVRELTRKEMDKIRPKPDDDDETVKSKLKAAVERLPKGMKDLSSDALVTITKFLPAQFVLGTARYLSKRWKKLSKHAKVWEDRRLWGSETLPDSELIASLEYLENVENIDLTKCVNITTSGFNSILPDISPRGLFLPKHLQLDSQSIELLAALSMIDVLEVYGANLQAVDENSLPDLAEMSKNMQEFTLEDFSNLPDQMLTTMFRNFRHLQHLHLYEGDITGEMLKLLIEPADELQTLDLRGIKPRLDSKALQEINFNWLGCLRLEGIADAGLAETMEKITSNCKVISKLFLDNIPKLEDKADRHMDIIGRNCKRLQHLLLSNVQVTSEGMDALKPLISDFCLEHILFIGNTLSDKYVADLRKEFEDLVFFADMG